VKMGMEILYLQADLAKLQRQVDTLEENLDRVLEYLKKSGGKQVVREVQLARRRLKKQEEEIARGSRV